MKSRLAPLAVVLVLAVAIFAWYRYWSPWKPSNPSHGDGGKGGGGTSVIAVSDFDAFQQNLAKRVSERFGVDPASVVIAPADYNLGWLLDTVQTYPADSTDCVPTPTPGAIQAGHLFPSYRLSSNTAATMTLGSDALQQLTSASLNVSHQANLVYSIDNVQVVLMDLKSVEQISRSGACGAYVAQHPKTRLIRGLVTGKISFKFDTSDPISAEAKLPKLGGISAKGDPDNSTVTVTDDHPSQILEMVSILEPVTVVATSVAPPPTTAQADPRMPAPGGAMARPTPPPPTSVEPRTPGGAHIFLQQDMADATGAGVAVAAKLQEQWPKARVESKVERIPTAKMPSAPQIRFFNAGDEALANTCRERLKEATGIDARVVRVGLSAPAGQLEVWLQKSGSM